MSMDAHERAQKLITSARYNGVAAAERVWLESHLAACATCARYAEQIEAIIGGLRSVSVMPSPGLVSVTQVRVRARAQELRARQAAMRPLWIACAVAVLLSMLTTPYLWIGFRWLGRTLGLPDPMWVAAFAMSWALPAIVGVALIIARQTHSAPQEESPITRNVA